VGRSLGQATPAAASRRPVRRDLPVPAGVPVPRCPVSDRRVTSWRGSPVSGHIQHLSEVQGPAPGDAPLDLGPAAEPVGEHRRGRPPARPEGGPAPRPCARRH